MMCDDDELTLEILFVSDTVPSTLHKWTHNNHNNPKKYDFITPIFMYQDTEALEKLLVTI